MRQVIKYPNLIGGGGLGGGRQTIGRDGVVVVAVGGAHTVAALLAAAEARGPHEPGDAFAALPVTLLAQGLLHPGTAVSLPALGVNGLDAARQTLIGQGAWTGRLAALLPGVVTAGGDGQVMTQGQDGMAGLHRVNPAIAFVDGSERRPNVFFKMSRCSRKGRFSRRALSSCAWRSAGEPGQSPSTTHTTDWL